MADHRVVITGIGIVSPIGIGVLQFWENLLAGANAVQVLDRFDAAQFPSRIAAQVNDFDPSSYLSRRRVQWTDIFSQYAVVAAMLAIEDAAIDVRGRSDIGVYTGSALGGIALAEEQIAVFYKEGLRAVRPLLTLSVFGGAAPSNIAIEYGLHGPTIANSDSCAAGAIAIGQAFEAVRSGCMRVAIAGGVEAPLAPLSFGAFTVARAMSTRNDAPKTASRPFDRSRDGFVMAEGAGILVLERYEDAIARDAQIYAEIIGFGASNDAFHMAAPLEDGSQVASAMRAALRDAKLHPDEIEAISAHGSSTPSGDRAELHAYAAVFGERAKTIPIITTKAQHAHALGATGAWEVAISALSLAKEKRPSAVNFESPDEGYTLNVSSNGTTPCTILKNSSGFGGINAGLVLKSA